MAGLTRPVIDMISAPGNVEETEIIAEEEKLKLVAPSESSVSEIEGGFYDPMLGVLTLTMYNGEQIRIAGFPTADKIPPGPTGPEGQRGQDGKPGKPGREGLPGEIGCTGPEGGRGPMGPPGLDGRPGMQGPPGIRGMTGPQGPVGFKGPTGPIGPVGPTGPRGDPGPAGEPGAPGPDGNVNIIISTTDPGAVGAGWLWVNPNGGSSGGSQPTQPSDPPPGSVPWP